MSTRLVFDLSKATKNLTNLVQVQRMVTRKGKTFYQNFWVMPAQVKSTDKVLGQSPVGNFDFSKFDSLKDTDREAAIKYAEACGIQWTQNSNPGINWMRVCMAAKKASGISVPQGGKPKQKPVTPVAKPQTQTTPVITGKTYDLSSLSASFDTYDGKDKVNALKTVISKEDMFVFAKNAGVTWDEHPHAGINNMRMQMALANWAESHSLADCKPYAVSKSGGAPALAKMPNKKSTPLPGDTSAKSEPKQKDTKLEIPDAASDRDKAMIALINSVNSKTDLDAYKKLGIIAEDDDAKKYLLNTLLPNTLAAKNPQSNDSVYGRYSTPLNAAVANGLVKTMKGFTSSLIKKGVFDELHSSLDSRIFTAPREVIGLGGMLYNGELIKPEIDRKEAQGVEAVPGCNIDRVLIELQQNFGEYIPSQQGGNGDYHNIKSPAGYTRFAYSDYDPYLAHELFDFDKDGVVVSLNNIAESQPELKDTVEDMKKSYKECMKLFPGDITGMFDMLKKNETQLELKRKEIQEIYESSEALRDVFTQSLSEDEYKAWKSTLSTWSGQHHVLISPTMKIDLRLRNPKYDYGKPIDDDNWAQKDVVIDLSTITLKDGTNAKDFFTRLNKGNPAIITKESLRNQYKYEVENNIYTKETQDKLRQNLLKFLGGKIELKDYSTKYGGLYSSQMPIFTPDSDEKRDAVMTNLLHMRNVANAFSSTADILSSNSRPSALNGQQENHENVFNYIEAASTMYSQYYGNSNFGIYYSSKEKYSAEEFLKLLKQQHKQTKVYSSNDLKDIRTNLMDFNEARYSQYKTSMYPAPPSNPDKSFYAYVGGYRSGLDVYHNTLDNQGNTIPVDHPLFTVMMDDLSTMVLKNKAIRNARVTSDEKAIQVMKGNLGIMTQTDDEDLAGLTKAYRKSVLDSIKCSLATVPEAKYRDIQHQVKVDWDQVTHGRNSAVFHGAYEIKNLEHEERFKAACERMNEKPKQYYHGTSFAATSGILGGTGHFRVPKDSSQVSAGSMLGYGVYLADKSSKSAQYFRGYNNGRYGCGSLLVCDAILGKQMPYVGTGFSPSYDTSDGTVCACTDLNSRYSLCNNEWAVRNEDFVIPRILVDMENARRT